MILRVPFKMKWEHIVLGVPFCHVHNGFVIGFFFLSSLIHFLFNLGFLHNRSWIYWFLLSLSLVRSKFVHRRCKHERETSTRRKKWKFLNFRVNSKRTKFDNGENFVLAMRMTCELKNKENFLTTSDVSIDSRQEVAKILSSVLLPVPIYTQQFVLHET